MRYQKVIATVLFFGLCSPSTVQASTYFSDSFEAGLSNWTQASTNTHIHTPQNESSTILSYGGFADADGFDFQQVSYRDRIFQKTKQAGNWSRWDNVTDLVTNNQPETVTSFHTYIHSSGIKNQIKIVDHAVYTRSYNSDTNIWSEWVDSTAALNLDSGPASCSTGNITDYSAWNKPQLDYMTQAVVINGNICSRDKSSGSWSNWSDITSSVSSAATQCNSGTITGFSAWPNVVGDINQAYVRGGQVCTRSTSGSTWSTWENISDTLSETKPPPPQDGVGILEINTHESGSGHITYAHPNQITGRVSIWYYDHLKTGINAQISVYNSSNPSNVLNVGVNPDIYNDTFFLRSGNNTPPYNLDTHLNRSAGWHQLDIYITPKGSYARIDGTALSYLGKEDQGYGVNPTLTKFNRLEIHNLASSSIAQFDQVIIDVPQFITTTPNLPLLNTLTSQMYFDQYEPPVFDDLVVLYPVPLHKFSIAARMISQDSIIAAAAYQQNQDPLLQDRIQQNQSQLDSKTSWHNGFHTPIAYAYQTIAQLAVWETLDNSQKSHLKEFAAKGADELLNDIPETGHVDNSKAEENSFRVAILQLAINLNPNHPNSSQWQNKFNQFLYHTFTPTNETHYEVTTQTLYPDYKLDNHQYSPHPNYALAAIGNLAKVNLANSLFQNPTAFPAAIENKISNVWDRHQPHFDPITLLITNTDMSNTFGGKDDWGTDLNWSLHALWQLNTIASEPSYQDVLNNIWYTKQHYLAFPTGDDLYLPGDYDNTQNQFSTHYSLDSEHATRVALSYFLDSPPVVQNVIGDLDSDFDVDYLDYLTFIPRLIAGLLTGDIDGNGLTNIFDLNQLLQAM